MSPNLATSSPVRPIADAALVRRVRWRLLAWSGGTTLAAMVILGALLYGTVSWSLATAGEDQLRARAREIVAGLAMVNQRITVGSGLGPLVFDVSHAAASWSVIRLIAASLRRIRFRAGPADHSFSAWFCGQVRIRSSRNQRCDQNLRPLCSQARARRTVDS